MKSEAVARDGGTDGATVLSERGYSRTTIDGGALKSHPGSSSGHLPKHKVAVRQMQAHDPDFTPADIKSMRRSASTTS